VEDPLDLKSAVALVIDQDSHRVLVSKNPGAILPIASISKLMTALVVVESGLPLDEMLSIDAEDVAATVKSRSRLLPGTRLSRGDLLQLALMASENRAANALGRHHPGGMVAFVQAMNRKAAQLGMVDSHFVEPTGLSPDNQASAMDLSRLVAAASAHALIRDFSTAQESAVPVGSRERRTTFHSTNGLIGNPQWDIALQKTGYISEAGRCLVMQARLAGRLLTMVLLDSQGRYARFGDAERIREWFTAHGADWLGQAMAPSTSIQ
jgi:D-alanyl-D-alanine endopeptidase (penicillin-binding protein 7)